LHGWPNQNCITNTTGVYTFDMSSENIRHASLLGQHTLDTLNVSSVSPEHTGNRDPLPLVLVAIQLYDSESVFVLHFLSCSQEAGV